jgi:hypothetical protein
MTERHTADIGLRERTASGRRRLTATFVPFWS